MMSYGRIVIVIDFVVMHFDVKFSLYLFDVINWSLLSLMLLLLLSSSHLLCSNSWKLRLLRYPEQLWITHFHLFIIDIVYNEILMICFYVTVLFQETFLLLVEALIHFIMLALSWVVFLTC